MHHLENSIKQLTRDQNLSNIILLYILLIYVLYSYDPAPKLISQGFNQPLQIMTL